MAWKEYNKDEPFIPEEETAITGRELMLVLIFCMIAILMYMLGKSDGREDALNENVINCATVEIIEKP